MTDEEKVEQARALSDAGVFRKKIVGRVPRNLYSDTATLECGHTSSVPRSASDYTEWECSECCNAFEPTPAWKKSLWSRWYVYFGPLILLIIFYSVMLPRWTEDGNKREAQKQQEWQELKDRVTKLEEMVKELKARR
jgi:hypothetical protein